MKVTYIHGYAQPKELDVISFTACGDYVIINTDDGGLYEAKCVVYEDGKLFAHLSENA